MLIFLLVWYHKTFVRGQVVSQEDITVWTFRSDNENNANVQASYTGPTFTKEWTDFTICLRYRILYFVQGGDGFNIFQGIDDNTHVVHLQFTRVDPNCKQTAAAVVFQECKQTIHVFLI